MYPLLRKTTISQFPLTKTHSIFVLVLYAVELIKLDLGEKGNDTGVVYTFLSYFGVNQVDCAT